MPTDELIPPDFGADDYADEYAPKPPSVFSIKKRLNGEASRLTRLHTELTNMELASETAPSDGAALVLACVRLELDLSSLDVDYLGQTFADAQLGRLNSLCKDALKVVSEERSVVEAAYKGVLAMDAAGKVMRPEWSNLPPLVLAREVNQQAHSFFRGRLPGWKD